MRAAWLQTCFNLIDIDGSGSITLAEFQKFGFIFNISKKACQAAFREFDVDNSKELDYTEFRMFCLVCLDKQRSLEQKQARVAGMKLSSAATRQIERLVSGCCRGRGQAATTTKACG
jgi:hypothetical protein